MPDPQPPPEPKPSTPADPTPVDPEEVVVEAARKQQDKQVTLDSFDDPDVRKRVESLVSQSINEYREKARKDGKIFTEADVTEHMKNEFARRDAETEAKLNFREHLMDLGIKRGSEDYEKFNAEVAKGFYDPTKLGDRELIERIARNAQVGQFKVKDVPTEGVPLPPSGAPLRIEDNKQTAKDPGMEYMQQRLKEIG